MKKRKNPMNNKRPMNIPENLITEKNKHYEKKNKQFNIL